MDGSLGRGMRPRTPLIGRTEELAFVAAALDAGGCIVAGPAGVGKSRLLAAASDTDQDPIHVLATRSAASVPFGAFGHLLPWERADPTTIIPAFIAHLRAAHPNGQPLVVVDDAHELDDGSAALLLALAASGTARLLVAIRTPEPTSDAVAALWKDGLLPRVELQALGPRDVRGLMGELLDGDIHATAASRVHDLTQGNALFVVELVRHAAGTGALAPEDGRWRWREDLLELDGLGELIGRRVHSISDEASGAFERVAVAGSLPLRLLASMAGPEAVEELEQSRLVRLVGDINDPDVTPIHPLFAEVVAASLARTRAARLRRELAAAHPVEAARHDHDRLRTAIWAMGAGDDNPGLYVAASATALRLGVPDVAMRLAERAGDTLAGAMARAGALISLGRFDAAVSVIEPYRAEARASDEAVGLMFIETWFRSLLCSRRADSDLLDMLDDVEGWDDSPAWAAWVAASRGWVAQYGCRPTSALDLVTSWREATTIGPYDRFRVLAMAFYAHLRLARTDEALETAAEIQDVTVAMAAGPWLTRYAEVVLASLARIDAARDLDLVGAVATEALADATRDGDAASRVVATMQLGFLALRRGHAGEAARLLGDAVDALETADPGLDLFSTSLRLTIAQALTGDRDAAHQALSRAEQVAAEQPRMARRQAAELDLARHLVACVAGATAPAIDGLLAIADAGLEDPTVEGEALHHALRLGAPPAAVIRPLRALVGRTEHDLLDLLLTDAEARAARDPARQLEVAELFAERGLDLHAAEAAGVAARGFQQLGDLARANAASVMADLHRVACGPLWSPVLAVPLSLPELTPRELEIARMAALGMSNKAIAEQLVISVRTVETCVQRAYRKLGVSNRGDLADIFAAEQPVEA